MIKLTGATQTILAVVSAAMLSACGGAAGGAIPPTSPTANLQSAQHPAKMAALSVPAPVATSTPFNPAALPILPDTSPSTSGVFLGDACGVNAVVGCPQFASTFRHGIAYGTTYSTWDVRLGVVLARTGMATWGAQGTIPEITWAPKNTKTPVTLAAIASGAWDTYIMESADDVKNFGQPVLLRPFHEFNGNMYPWTIGQNGDDAAADANFIAAWRRIVTIFRNQGATNAKFIWCYNNTAAPNDQWNQPASTYPGDRYVDWVAFDGYNTGDATNGKNWFQFNWIAAKPYAEAIAIAPTKPIMVGETASNEYGDGGAAKAAWISAMFAELASPTNPYPNLRAVTWFEANTNGYLYDSESTTPTYETFAQSIRAYSSSGVLHVRSNGAAMWSITSV